MLSEITDTTSFQDVGFVFGTYIVEEDVVEEVPENSGDGFDVLGGADVKVLEDTVRSDGSASGCMTGRYLLTRNPS